MLDEFLLSEIKANRGWRANKWGYHWCRNTLMPLISATWICKLSITGLDHLPTHYDSVANYTHYNQPLAHPLMAGFSETIGVARYQPAPKTVTGGQTGLLETGPRQQQPELWFQYLFTQRYSLPPGRLWLQYRQWMGNEYAVWFLPLSDELRKNFFVYSVP